ncbi:MAG: hypothetical protein ACI87E_000755 [Mariniblastus sp.]|jgi:hypothetical protein
MNQSILFWLSLALVMGLAIPSESSAQRTQNSAQKVLTIRVPYKSKSYVGRPLIWDGQEMMLLRRDGKISILPVKTENDYQRIKTGFDPLSLNAMQLKLQKEFGSKYQVSTTQNFVVVHPPGDYMTWASPFQVSYSRFRAYFSSRGFTLEHPEFPMVAVVLRTRAEFDRFLRDYHDYDSEILGYYSPRSNRIITYDQSAGRSTSKDWFFNADTVIHEAAHQSAFNTGIHSRFAPVPRWISEGLAMLFEAPGVNNSMYYSRRADRINPGRLRDLKHFYQQGEVKGKLPKLILTDDLFRTDPQLAYAYAWGVTFFLSETMPDAYHQFLRHDGQRTNFEEYARQQKADNFAAAFGSDIAGLEARMKRFIDAQKIPPIK